MTEESKYLMNQNGEHDDISDYKFSLTTRDPVKCADQGLNGTSVTLSMENVLTALILELIENPKVADIFNRISKDQHDEGEDEFLMITKDYLEWYAEMYQHRRGL